MRQLVIFSALPSLKQNCLALLLVHNMMLIASVTPNPLLCRLLAFVVSSQLNETPASLPNKANRYRSLSDKRAVPEQGCMTYIRIVTTNMSLMDEQAQESLRMLYKKTRLSIVSRQKCAASLFYHAHQTTVPMEETISKPRPKMV